jgi:serine/threonine-protein kinase
MNDAQVNDSEAIRFLQSRLGRFARISGSAGLTFAAVWLMAVVVFDDGLKNLSWTGLGLVVAGSLSFLVMAALAKRPVPGIDHLHRFETIGILIASGAFSAAGVFMSSESRPEEAIRYVLFFTVMARSIYVPSRGRRTFLIGFAVAFMHVLCSLYLYQKGDHHWSGSGLVLDPVAAIAFNLLTAIVGWLFVLFLATAASGVIYGLRREIGEARRLGPYTLVRKIGEGGMGEVYEARHAMLRRPTAIKLLLPTKASEEDIRRFEREVQLSSRLCHPNTITIYDYGRTRAGIFYYAMELLDGAPIERLVDFEGPVAPGRVARILYQVAGALQEAHGLGLIHRDVKPANILLCRHGGEYDVAKLVDFGLVKSIRKTANPQQTEEDVMLGTPYYMSPEAIERPGLVDARSDIYSLGAVAFFLASGTHVFSGETSFAVCERHVHQEPDTVSERLDREFPGDFEKLIGDCLAKEPENRPQSATILRARLRALATFGSFDEDDAEDWWHSRGVEFLSRKRENDRSGLLAWADDGLATGSDLARP